MRRTLRRFFFALSGDAPPNLVPRLFKEQSATGGVLDRMPEPEELPPWLSEADLDNYARAYARTGFWGTLGVYRNQDRDWKDHPEIGTAGVRQPALFIGGRRDSAVLFGKFEPMEAAVPNLRRIVLLPNCGRSGNVYASRAHRVCRLRVRSRLPGPQAVELPQQPPLFSPPGDYPSCCPYGNTNGCRYG